MKKREIADAILDKFGGEDKLELTLACLDIISIMIHDRALDYKGACVGIEFATSCLRENIDSMHDTGRPYNTIEDPRDGTAGTA